MSATPDPPVGPFGGDVLAAAAVATLAAHVPAWSRAAGLDDIDTWDAVPTVEALSTAELPAGAVAVPGLTEAPVRRSGRYEGVYRLSVGVYDRGESYATTQACAGRWAAIVRTVLLSHPDLGLDGVVQSLTWIGEDLTVISDRRSARTLGGCTVAFDVAIDDLQPLRLAPPVDGAQPGDPTITQVTISTTLRPPTGPLQPRQDGPDAVSTTSAPARPPGT